MIDKYTDSFGLALNSSDVMKIFQSGRIASMIGIEGLHQIGGSSNVLRVFHRLGVRYVTLTHNKDNQYADSAVSVLTTCAPTNDWLINHRIQSHTVIRG
jgi:membrane dipeptidase